MSWLRQPKPIKGLLLDITGVLYNSNPATQSGLPIEGSIDAVKRLVDSDIKVRFLSNESTTTRQGLATKLQKLGFPLHIDQIQIPAPVAVKYLNDRKLRPFLIVTKEALPEFSELDQSNPNCVLMGDAEDDFSYEMLNKAFKLLMKMEDPKLFTMGTGKYYMSSDGELTLDVGSFSKVLEYSCDIKSENIGKPNQEFFLSAVKDMGLEPEEVAMIGDDIISDIGGSQKAGIRGVLVRTGKWRPQWENHPNITPDAIVDNLSKAVEIILA